MPDVQVKLAPSLQDQLRTARAQTQENTVETLLLPGYDGRLAVQYHMLDWKRQRAIARSNAKVRDQATQELYTAADTLIASCDKVEIRLFAEMDKLTREEAVVFNDMGHKLDAAFAEYLGLHDPAKDGSITDRQALFLIIPRQVQVVVHASTLIQRQTGIDEEIDENLVGESAAAS